VAPINTWPTVIVFPGRNIGTGKKGAVNSKFGWMAEILPERRSNGPEWLIAVDASRICTSYTAKMLILAASDGTLTSAETTPKTEGWSMIYHIAR
jgi:hypothetical protein